MIRKFRRLILLTLLVFATGVLLSGCGGEKKNSTEGQQNLSGTQLSFLMLGNYKGDTAAKLIPQFEKETGIKVKMDLVPLNNLFDKMSVALASKSGSYDVLFIDEPYIPALAQYLLPLDDFIKRDNLDPKQFIPTTWAAGAYQGKQYAIPVDANVPILFYRKDIFEEKGLKPPKTWSEAYELAKKLNDPGKDFYGYAIAGKKDIQTGINATMFLWSWGGEVLDSNNNFGFASDAGVAALNHYKKMTEVAPPGVLGYTLTEVNSAMQQGKVAMIHNWCSVSVDLTNPNKSKVADKIGFAVLPAEKQFAPMRGVWTIGIAKDSKKAEAAWKFVKWLTSKPAQMVWNAGGATTPTRYDILQDPEYQKKFPWIPVVLQSLEKAKSRPRISNWNSMQELIDTMASEVLSGQISPEEAGKKYSILVAENVKK
ncbi:extracellular solute-binding protein [Moorella sp. Hama-1]|uniref:extracellular solute-binding protein n=1 Tax=Moorella sp. Hama-1 TaxID=2138101 RepID=UPI000D64B80D|nr:extracellular solute-binding protein [Moorella sp. Hama-1]BCV22470.1 ABC transporter substrate-binding protein [Moorella sp. Hama-1]